MTVIVADVGGTHTRVARANGGLLDRGTLRRLATSAHGDFASVLQTFGMGQATALCVAIAGPVTERHARLTNLDWVIDADAFGIPVQLVNDLQAVGYGLDRLPEGALQQVHAGAPVPGAQRLVVGLGTGFNVSVVSGAAVHCAEYGHASLPLVVAEWVSAKAGTAPFTSVEDLFSGKGLEALHRLITAQAAPSEQIVGEAPQTLAVFGEALGILTTQLVYHYLPLGGIVLNGGLARAIMGTQPGRQGFARGFVMRDKVGAGFSAIPVHLVTDDAAALYGCVGLASR
ncbi:MAG: glucokinase [Pseudomonadota bacterium]